MRFRHKSTGEVFEVETYSFDIETGVVWVQRITVDGKPVLGGDAEIRVDDGCGCEPIDQDAADMLARVRAEVETDARHLRQRLAETGPLRPGEVDEALREARDLRAKYARAEPPADRPVADYTVLALPRYQAAALVFSALRTLGEYPADAPDYDRTTRDYLMAALERLAPGLGNPAVLGLPHPVPAVETSASSAPGWVEDVLTENDVSVKKE